MNKNKSFYFQEILNAGDKDELPRLNIPENIFEKFSENYHHAIYETKKHIQEEVRTKIKKSILVKRPNKKRKQNVVKKKPKLTEET